MITSAFLSGAITLAFGIAALHFLKFWRKSRDQLFFAFAASFLLLGLGQAALVLGGVQDEQRPWVYLLRLAAFLIIVAAVLRKNRIA
ncbi:DUF5985 family protein [Sphingomonas xinjiangensis]|uniref:Uncharacterized protein n=1 Tax=Sphingomonas xinjiangensis TaxID=643568 RepID=A0A840YAY6_9SPHN|nr:hypothetical protein [Sphingomonas xinjiangensis]